MKPHDTTARAARGQNRRPRPQKRILGRTLGRRGAVAMMFGLSAIALMLCTGVAVDAARLWLLRSRLQSAVDAAVLQAVAANEDPAHNDKAIADASRLFWTNYGRTSSAPGTAAACPNDTANRGFIASTVCGASLSVTFPDTYHAQVQATAVLDMTIMKLGGFNTMQVSASAYGQRAGGVEVALVLDISLSMNFNTSDGTGNTKLAALQTASKNMLAALYGGADTVPNLYVSMVPFAGAVNIGNSHRSWLDVNTFSCTYDPTTCRYPTFQGKVDNDGSGAGWRGCVEARQGSGDVAETDPGTSPLLPFYWPSTWHQYPNQTYPNPAGSPQFWVGDNEWQPGNITDTSSASQSGSFRNIPLVYGPNLGCPHNAVLPLTASSTTVGNAIKSLTATGPIGTVVAQGLQWGWLTISPSWRGSSGWNINNTAGTPLPLPYTAQNNKKVIVLMTDGTTDVSGSQTWYGPANNLSSYWGACPDPSKDGYTYYLAPSCIPSNGGGGSRTPPKSTSPVNWYGDADTWYSPYGRASAGRLGTAVQPANTGNAASDSEQAVYDFSGALDQRTALLCSNIKAQGIIIYSIFFHGPQDDQVDTILGHRQGSQGAANMLKACATDAGHYYDANNLATLNSAFVQIAQQISALRIQK